ncbi:type I restriction-modification enzyme R subunit C-terminal domain-containing protein [Planctomycetota bacterium]
MHERYQNWLNQQAQLGRAFTPEQRQWLDLICDHITTSLAVDLEDFDYTPFTQYGGLGRAHQVFGPDLTALLEELNRTLAA